VAKPRPKTELRAGFKGGSFIRQCYHGGPVVRYAFGGNYTVMLDERVLNKMIAAAARSRSHTCTLGPVQVQFHSLKVKVMENANED
jgi:hypothetical protein